MIPSPNRLDIHLDHGHDYGPILVVNGDVDSHTVPVLARAVGRAADLRPRRLLLDLTGVSHLGSAGIEVLLDAYAAGERTLLAVIATGPTARVLHTAGVDTVIAVYPYRAMALVCTAAAVASPG
ncbi:STAS domain-containing protein [Nocardia sp. NPDC005978]|uniref:STAS domain-containing protein n=1 Tax=Nocardia sp. NPDC005978 TaxID=3156725 RepID=UPI00339E3F97